ncbi:MAG: CHC2 zinc finger domain-containing protein [Clostridia bacterium]|nr:CHC2 zinc finger domain-containing protein [Clostridia bacterium]
MDKRIPDAVVWSEQIQDRIKMRDVITMYVGRTDKPYGRIPCPFHHGHHNNLGYTDEVFHCFVCEVKGNVISFVAQLYGLTNIEAMKKIDEDFHLDITGKKPTLMTKRAAKRRAKERKQRETRLAELNQSYYELARLHAFLFRSMTIHKPESENEDAWHPVYVYAAQHLSEIEYQLDELMEEIYDRSN